MCCTTQRVNQAKVFAVVVIFPGSFFGSFCCCFLNDHLPNKHFSPLLCTLLPLSLSLTLCWHVDQAVAKGKGNADGRDGGHASPVDYYSAMESPSRSHHPAMPPPQQQQQQHQPHQLPTPDYEMPDYDFLQRHQQQQHHQQQQQQQQHHGMPYDPYRMGHPIQQQQSPMNGGGAGGMDPNQPGQFYLHEPSPTSRRTWGQPQPISPAPPPPSMVYRPDDMLGYGMPPQQQQQQQQQQQPRRAQWGTPQPVGSASFHSSFASFFVLFFSLTLMHGLCVNLCVWP
jgi:hypothetical protein